MYYTTLTKEEEHVYMYMYIMYMYKSESENIQRLIEVMKLYIMYTILIHPCTVKYSHVHVMAIM